MRIPRQWLADIGRRGGEVRTSTAKSEQARINGRKHLPAGEKVVTAADEQAVMQQAVSRACKNLKRKESSNV
jgi:hypothetical protein